MSGYEPRLPPSVLDALQIFANTAWHNPVAFLRTHHSSTSRDIEYLDVQNHSVALQYLFGNALAQCNKILVRDEYRDALQALQSDSAYKRGAFIIGQPGIGKTYFLIYALIKRLGEHKPVAVQLRASDPFYAFFTHTCTLCSLCDPAPLVEEDVWALSDLRVSTAAPLDIFLDVSAKVIQATPCGTKHWERWSKYHGAAMFVMNVWTIEEITDLSSLFGFDVERMTALSSKWGGVPRMLLQQSTNSESQQRWELRRAVTSALDNHTNLHTLDAQDVGGISAVFFVLPPKDRAGNVSRRRYVIRVPTEMLQNALAIALQRMQIAARVNFFLTMFDHPETWGCARSIYVNWFYSQMILGNGFFCSWADQNNCTHPNLLQELRNATKKNTPIIRDVTKITEITEPPCIWIGPSGEIPGIDCVVFTNSVIFTFQVSTSFQVPLPVPPPGLDNLKTILPERWKNNLYTPWVFSFVAISQVLLGNASKYYWSNKPYYAAYFGSCVVDPAQFRAPYKAYTCDDRDGSEVDYYEGESERNESESL